MDRVVSFVARLCWTILIVALAACQKGAPPLWPDADVAEPDKIVATSDTVAIPPGGSRQLGFHLLDAHGAPVSGAVISFAIVDKPETPGSGGAKLSLSSGLTDEQGLVTLQVIAGAGSEDAKPLAFSVNASAGQRSFILPIFVTSGVLASAEFVPQVEGGNADVVSISLTFYDDTACADLSQDHPPPSIRQASDLGPDTPSVTISSVVTSGVHAVLAVATGTRGRVVAKGCVDLPGNSLSPSQVMRVLLPLARMRVSPVGTYHVDAQFSISAPLPGTVSLREQWKILSSQPCDPATIWLDCTIDALSGDTLEDPLDCQPVTGGEGALGEVLRSKRPLAGSGRDCASQLDASGKASLDTKVHALFPASFLSRVSLAKLPDELTTALSQLALSSTLTVVESGLADVLNIEHALDTLSLLNPNTNLPIPLSAEDLGLPVRDVWFSSRQTRAGQLELASHGFTLRLGSLARQITSTTSLTSRLGIADAGGFVSALFDGAARSSRSTSLRGCDALDSLLCEEAGLEHDCIKLACLDGLEKLGQLLDTSFAILDGPELDFFIWGSASLVDNNDDRQAERLDSGLMTASLNTRTSSTIYGGWSAERITPKSP